MAESVLDVRHLPKAEAYAQLAQQLRSTLEGIDDAVAAMATFACVLHHGLGHLWTGFYRVVQPGKLLRVGPYQGSLGCLEIAFGRGVCGTAAASGKTVRVAEVSAFAGHISCDSRSRSEIVVPVWDGRGELLAVLDLDSEQVAAFDEADEHGLEMLMSWFRNRAFR